tara:strand:- start:346 stop:1596 length:1251 start_codon:yes stop_codon:yes gene_type:complete
MKKNAKKDTENNAGATEESLVRVLISGAGNINIEKESDESFKVVVDKSLQIEDKTFTALEEAKKHANTLLYKQLGRKFEKSIRSENLVLLTGAGASMECGGPSMLGLWKIVSEDTSITTDWSSLLTSAGYAPEIGKENLEDLLSRLQTLTRAHKINSSGTDFENVIEKIEAKILEECKKVQIGDNSSHIRFISRILKGRSASSPRLKVFTLNYDTAFEQTGDKIKAVVLDGFLLSKNFKSVEFDLDIVQRERSRIHNEENFYSKVFQLYKMHGSVDWDSSGEVIQKNETPTKPTLIYPNSSKFERSFEMPFFEMVSRLQSVLRKENTTLFVVGYGFGDEHVNRIIGEALKNNLNLEIFIVKPNLQDISLHNYIEKIEKGSMNIHLIGNTFDELSTGVPDVKIGEHLLEEEKNEKPI